MITYHYQCINEECKIKFEILQSIKDDAITKCPQCEQETVERIISGGADMIVKHEAKTLGLWAERNGKQKGRMWREDKEREIKQKGREGRKYLGKLKEGASQMERTSLDYTPWWRKNKPVDRTLGKMTPEQKQRYIITGKK